MKTGHSDSHDLCKGVDKFLRVNTMFIDKLGKLLFKRAPHVGAFNDYEFCENPFSGIPTLLNDEREISPHFLPLSSDLDKILYKRYP